MLIRHALEFHHPVNRPTGRAAAKAVIELLRGAHREGRGFLAVKRAAGKIVCPALLERQVAFDDLDDIDASEKILDEGLRNHDVRTAPRGAIPMNPSCRAAI